MSADFIMGENCHAPLQYFCNDSFLKVVTFVEDGFLVLFWLCLTCCYKEQPDVLGIIDLHLQNKALLLKHLDKFYYNADVPWVKLVRDAYYHDTVPHAITLSGSFWWRDVLGLVDTWKNMLQGGL
jgi:hypothetical protein